MWYMEPMKTTIDIPDDCLAAVMHFTGADTKRDAVVTALREYNRRRKVESVLAAAGTFPDFRSHEEFETADLDRQQHLTQSWQHRE